MNQYEPYPKTAKELRALPEMPAEFHGRRLGIPILQDLVIKIETDAGEIIQSIYFEGRWMKFTSHRRCEATK